MTAGSGESQSAAPYGRALWDADKKSALFAEVVKSTEIAKMAGVLERTEEKSEATLKLYRHCCSVSRRRYSRKRRAAHGWCDSSKLAHRPFSRPAPARRRIQALEESGRQGDRFWQGGRSGKTGAACSRRFRQSVEDGAARS